MRLLFALKEAEGKPVSDSYGYQKVVASLLDESDQIVVIIDSNVGSYFIERVINRFAINLYESGNFTKIDDEEQWKTYQSFFNIAGIIPK